MLLSAKKLEERASKEEAREKKKSIKGQQTLLIRKEAPKEKNASNQGEAQGRGEGIGDQERGSKIFKWFLGLTYESKKARTKEKGGREEKKPGGRGGGKEQEKNCELTWNLPPHRRNLKRGGKLDKGEKKDRKKEEGKKGPKSWSKIT